MKGIILMLDIFFLLFGLVTIYEGYEILKQTGKGKQPKIYAYLMIGLVSLAFGLSFWTLIK